MMGSTSAFSAIWQFCWEHAAADYTELCGSKILVVSSEQLSALHSQLIYLDKSFLADIYIS